MIPYAGSVAVLVGSRTILCGQPVSVDEELMISEIDRLAGLIQPLVSISRGDGS